jgi:thiol-disulfide isomerase/thioredoxin
MKRRPMTLAMLAGTALLTLAAAPFAYAQEKDTQAQQEPAKAAPTLTIGDKAPALKVGTWVKGAPVEKFESGKIYVVEFWATWCGPCRKSIPHITELAHQYKDKVTFIGVSVWESGDDYLQSVTSFVESMGEKMDYTVAADDKAGDKGTMAQTWMTAAKQRGIPAAFIVNGEGRIAWIGHPMELDDTIAQVVAGTWDLNKAAAEARKQAEEEAARESQMAGARQDYQKVQEAMAAGDNAEVVKALDTMIEKYPAFSLNFKMQKFDTLLKHDEAGAYAFARTLADDFASEPRALNYIAWTILDNEDLKKPDFGVALALATKAADATKRKDWMILDTLALATFKAGDASKAVEIQTTTIELARADKAEEEEIGELVERLNTFKAGVK